MNTQLNNILTLKLNLSYQLLFKADNPWNQIQYFDQITITLQKGDSPLYTLYTNDNAIYAIRSFNKVLHNILQYKRDDPSDFNDDLGLTWTKIVSQELKEYPHNLKNGIKRWIGLRYLMWELPNEIENYISTSTWLYPNNGNFIFLVTPNYTEREPLASFINNYKPLVKIILDKTIIEHLAQWSTNMLALMEENDKKLRLQYEQNNPY